MSDPIGEFAEWIWHWIVGAFFIGIVIGGILVFATIDAFDWLRSKEERKEQMAKEET